MNWNKLAKEVHQVAVEKGLWDKPVCFDDLALECHAALSRAWGEHKAGRPNLYHLCQPSGEKRLACTGEDCPHATGGTCDNRDTKPRGVAAELAGCVLRLLDFVWREDLDMFMCVALRNPPKIECGMTWFLLSLITNLVVIMEDSVRPFSVGHTPSNIVMAITLVMEWANENNVDMEAVLREVLEYHKRQCATKG